MSSLLAGMIEPLPLLLGHPAVIDANQFEWLAIRPRKSARLPVYSSPEQAQLLRELVRLQILEVIDYRELLEPHLDAVIASAVAYLDRPELKSAAKDSAELWLNFVLSSGGQCLPDRAAEQLAIVQRVLPQISRAKTASEVAQLCGHDAFDVATLAHVGQLTNSIICDWQMYSPHHRVFRSAESLGLHEPLIQFQCPLPRTISVGKVLELREILSNTGDMSPSGLDRLPIRAALLKDPTLSVNAYQLQTSGDGGVIVEWPLERRRDATVSDTMPSEHSVTSDSLPTLPSVFVSYARQDNEAVGRQDRWLDRLYVHLRPLEQQLLARIFSDRHVSTGERWETRLYEELQRASAIVLLVSPAFLASDFVRNFELPIVLRRSQEYGIPILSLILMPCAFEETRFSYPDPVFGPQSLSLSIFQAVNAPDHPLCGMTPVDQERALLEVARRVREICQRTSEQRRT